MALIELVEMRADGALGREMLAFVAACIMEVEVGTGAAKGACSPTRQVQRTGCRDRKWILGPDGSRGRSPSAKGSCLPSFLEARQTAERALVAVLQEACRHGVWTRAVDHRVKAMGPAGRSKHQGSRRCAEIDERVHAFLIRPVEGVWPRLMLGATPVQVRGGGRIIGRAVIVAVAVNAEGRREVLGVATGPSPVETFRTDFLRYLADVA